MRKCNAAIGQLAKEVPSRYELDATKFLLKEGW